MASSWLASLAVLALSPIQQSDAPLPRKPWFGAGLAQVEKGVKIVQVIPGTTAEAAGLKVDDVVVDVAGVKTANAQSVSQTVSGLTTGSKTKIVYLRGDKQATVEAEVKPRPADNGPNYETIYDQVVSKGNRIRIFVTRPKNVSGKLPALFLIQGIGYVSNEQPLTSTSGYGRICKAFNDKGYVTVRVEKPGLGDSDGGPANKVDFDTELDAFRQALLKTKSYPFVDSDKVVIFGHSMGGCEGPIVASEIPVKGLAVYGTVVRTWHEYVVDMFRHQSLLSGAKESTLDPLARNTVAALHLIFNEGLDLEQIKEKHPKWYDAARAIIPDGMHFSGVGLPFWRGCFAQNYAAYWEKLDTNVLSIYGASDFVAERIDHPMIADLVNRNRPGKAKFVEIPNSDHGFRNVATHKESQEFWGKPGKDFNPAILDVLTSWADSLTKG